MDYFKNSDMGGSRDSDMRGSGDSDMFSHVLVVTNRKLCYQSVTQQIEVLCKHNPAPLGILLREKDLNPEEYRTLAAEVLPICQKYSVPCILHTFIDVAKDLGCNRIHLPLHILREHAEYRFCRDEYPESFSEDMPKASPGIASGGASEQASGMSREVYITGPLADFSVVGVSVHSVLEAQEAISLGATYLTAGHIFSTDCKKGVPPRGLDFLREICSLSPVPVYAIGGIHLDSEQIRMVEECGAAGVCIMSGMMQFEPEHSK
jgi:thiamine-phosphate pyrophosphorylase